MTNPSGSIPPTVGGGRGDNKVKHTPGPWYPALDNIGSPKVVAGRVDVALMSWLGFTMGDWQVGGVEAQERRDEIAANARLISAAPELLAVLKLALERVIADQEICERSFLPEPYKSEQLELEQYRDIVKAAHAAIAKAEGRQ